MKPVFDIYSRQNFESMKLAGEMLNIPAIKIKESADKNIEISVRKKKYKFKYSNTTETYAFKIRRFTFGKYKSNLIHKCEDLPYMKWLLTLPNINVHLKAPIKRRIKELKLLKQHE